MIDTVSITAKNCLRIRYQTIMLGGGRIVFLFLLLVIVKVIEYLSPAQIYSLKKSVD